MKKLLMLPLVAAALILSAAPAGAKDKLPELPVDLDLGNKTSVAICHNVLHNGHVIIVNANALGAHEAHLGETDIILGTGLRADLVVKFGDDDAPCGSTTTTTLPPTTTTTLPPVQIPDVKCPDFKTSAELDAFLATLSTDVAAKVRINLDADKDGVLCENHKPVVVEKIVEKKVEVPSPPVVIEKETIRTVPVPTPAPTPAPTAPAGGELPRTGNGLFLPLMGGGVTAFGLILRRLFK